MGKLSTHILDTATGKPAAGVRIYCELMHGDHYHLVAEAITNSDGRTDTPLLSGDNFHKGRYRLSFLVGEYFDKLGLPLPEEKFLDVVPIEFGINDPNQNYHVPLVVTPWSYSTYRGS